MTKIYSMMLLFIVMFLSASTKLKAEERTPQSRPKVGVVLCGGGAKGAAHIGVLKVLEEENIPIDYIAGTSMGAIIGGLYAMGYNANQLDSIITDINWDQMMSNNTLRKYRTYEQKRFDDKYMFLLPFDRLTLGKDEDINASYELTTPGGIVNGNNILNLMTSLSLEYPDSINFNTLPIPYACVATDLVSGEPRVLNSGNISMAMRASMSIPGVFAPVEIDGKLYIDGGVVNNYPVDVVRDMGADIVIGVNFENKPAAENEFNSLGDILSQLVTLYMNNEQLSENIKDTDILLVPNIDEYSAMGFSKGAIDSLIVRGYRVADSARETFVELADRYFVGQINNSEPPTQIEEPNEYFINNIIFGGIDDNEAVCLERVVKISCKHNGIMTKRDIDELTSKIMGTKTFETIAYNLDRVSDDNTYNLNYSLKKGGANQIGVGFRADTEEVGSLLLYLGINENELVGSKGWGEIKVGINPYIGIGYSYIPSHFAKLNTSYKLRKVNIDFNDSFKDVDDFTYVANTLDLNASNWYMRDYEFTGGIRLEHYNYSDYFKESESSAEEANSNKVYLSYYLSAITDTRDNVYFPNKGMNIEVNANIYHTDFNSDFDPFMTLSFKAVRAIALDKKDLFTLIPSLWARVIFGDTNEILYSNFVGGDLPGRYTPQQIPFVGMNYVHIAGDNVGVAGLDFRSRISERHYIYLQANYMRSHDSLNHYLCSEAMDCWGVGIKYAYNSKLGPLTGSIFWSDYTNRVGASVNWGFYF